MIKCVVYVTRKELIDDLSSSLSNEELIKIHAQNCDTFDKFETDDDGNKVVREIIISDQKK